jgi:hypothetical protein
MDRDKYTIVDYFGPYPIDWDLYNMVMGIKTVDIMKTSIERPFSYNTFDLKKEKLKENKNPKK